MYKREKMKQSSRKPIDDEKLTCENIDTHHAMSCLTDGAARRVSTQKKKESCVRRSSNVRNVRSLRCSNLIQARVLVRSLRKSSFVRQSLRDVQFRCSQRTRGFRLPLWRECRCFNSAHILFLCSSFSPVTIERLIFNIIFNTQCPL